MPSIGRLTRYRPPAETVSDDYIPKRYGVYEGGEISMFYDPMIANCAAGRAGRAIDHMRLALDRFS